MNHTNPRIPGTTGAAVVVDKTEDQKPEEVSQDKIWLDYVRVAYEEGEDFYSGLKKRWDENYALARSEHPPGSKYHKKTYDHRSKLFRGKTEGAIRQNEAALSVAMFSNRDVVTINAASPDNEQQDIAAKALHELINYRLEGYPWLVTVLSAFHETMVPGMIVSKQYWDSGPESELIPPEMVRISKAADWRDPLGNSPYVQIITPAYIGDIRDKMDTGEWEAYTDHEILASRLDRKDEGTKQARDGRYVDRQDSEVNDFTVVDLVENYVKVDGQDYHFYSLGYKHLLTQPKPLGEIYPHTMILGRRNLVMGVSTTEPFNVYKRSLTDRVKQTQIHSNDLANQRFENVRLVLNKRYFAQRGSGTDYTTLKRSVAGSIILTNDLNGIKGEEVTDVTASSYQEQMMLNADFDELAGSFSQGSVMTNRQLNETVGGMQLMKGDANAQVELGLRIFVQTWAEPVLQEFIALEQTHEDEVIIKAITNKPLTRAHLQMPVKCRVSVGFGATDPIGKVQRLLMVLNSLKEVIPDFGLKLNGDAIAAEAFGLLGYQDGTKFYNSGKEDPGLEILQQQLKKLMEYIKTKQLEHQQKLEEIDRKGRWDIAVESVRAENRKTVDLTRATLDHKAKSEDLQIKREGLEMDAIKNLIDMIEAKNAEEELAAKKSGQIEEGI